MSKITQQRTPLAQMVPRGGRKVKGGGENCCCSAILTPPNCSGKMSPHGKQGDIDDERTAQTEDGDRLGSRESGSA
ncbi:MAG TPA: hypothetical protein VLA49_10885, partial [Anaerolineales bacterium]|nr:hypothetical protein [Anaerolineales bacterium]